MPTVIVLGGGVAGLSAAHELVERGFTVKVYEKLDVFGGKARSIDIAGTETGGRKPLPAEHGFRFFPGFYNHITDTMRRIPLPGGGFVFPNSFVSPDEITICQTTHPPWEFAANVPALPGHMNEWFTVLVSILTRGNLGLDRADAVFFAKKILIFLSSGHKRRVGQYEKLAWYDFVGANRSAQYEKILARSLTLMLVAMRAEEASTRTVGTIVTQLLIDIIDTNSDSDRVLNAPTNEAWIHPWVAHLTARGVTLTPKATVQGIQLNATQNQITGVTVNIAGAPQNVVGDYYVMALPVEIARQVLTTAQKNAAGIPGIDNLKTSWMNGVIFYLDQDIAISKGHTIYADSSWAVTAIPQRQFWNTPLTNYGDGTVQGVLSTVVSEWKKNGQHSTNKPAEMCSKAEVVEEVWQQIKAHHALAAPQYHLDAVNRIHSFVDPAIQFSGVPGVVNTSEEPLLINTIDSLKDRPEAQTAITNLVLASDYVVTHTDLATMEGANEAARRAVNSILVKAGSAQPPCQITPLKEPHFFDKIKEVDDIFYDSNPNGRPPMQVVIEALEDIVPGGAGSQALVPSSVSNLLTGTSNIPNLALIVSLAANAALLGWVLYLLFG